MQEIQIQVTSVTPTGDIDPASKELVVDSRELATALGVQHESIMRQFVEHQDTFDAVFKGVRFEIGTLHTTGGPQKTRFALLTEDQSLFVSTLSRNTAQAVAVKAKIITLFRAARKQIESLSSSVVPSFDIPKTKGEALRLAAELSDEVDRLQLENTAMKPKAEFAEKVLQTEDTQNIGTFAKSIGWGPNRMFQELRARGILFYREGKNIPRQEHIQAGRFKVNQVPKGDRLFPQTTITAAGMIWLTELLGVRNLA